jgi:hypothetical protein
MNVSRTLRRAITALSHRATKSSIPVETSGTAAATSGFRGVTQAANASPAGG